MHDDRHDRVESLSRVLGQLVDEEREADVRGAAVLDERPRHERLAAAFRPVVDDEHAIPVREGVALDRELRLVAAPVGLRPAGQLRAGCIDPALRIGTKTTPACSASAVPRTKPRASMLATFVKPDAAKRLGQRAAGRPEELAVGKES